MKNNVRSCIDLLFQDADRIDRIRIEVDVDDSADSGLFSKYTQEAASATIVDKCYLLRWATDRFQPFKETVRIDFHVIG